MQRTVEKWDVPWSAGRQSVAVRRKFRLQRRSLIVIILQVRVLLPIEPKGCVILLSGKEHNGPLLCLSTSIEGSQEEFTFAIFGEGVNKSHRQGNESSC